MKWSQIPFSFYLIAVLLFSSIGAIAQEETAEPTASAPFDIIPTIRMLYPQAIDFDLGVATPAENIARILLEFTLPDRSIRVDFNANSPAGTIPDFTQNNIQLPFTFAREFVSTRLIWDVPQASPLPPFTEIPFTWTVITTRDEVYILEDTLTYQDERATWTFSNNESETFSVAVPEGLTLDTADEIRLFADRTYDFLQARTGLSPEFNVIVYPPDFSVACRLNDDGEPVIVRLGENGFSDIECDVDLALRGFEQHNYDVLDIVRRTQFMPQYLETMIREFYPDLASNDDTQWLIEGLTAIYRIQPPSGELVVSQQAVRSGNLLSFAELAIVPEDTLERDVWDAQAYGILLFISETYGVDAFFEFINTLPEFDTFTQAYTETFQQDTQLLLTNWREWLFTNDAQRAYGYSFYAPTTATPTITPTMTDTPIPPTVTPTATATIDATSTPRPTATPIPPTATITPLPAQGFTVRATALPTAIPDESLVSLDEVNDTQFVVLGAIVGLVVLILAVFFITGRRSNT